jgi:hypothetical protein
VAPAADSLARSYLGNELASPLLDSEPAFFRIIGFFYTCVGMFECVKSTIRSMHYVVLRVSSRPSSTAVDLRG